VRVQREPDCDPREKAAARAPKEHCISSTFFCSGPAAGSLAGTRERLYFETGWEMFSGFQGIISVCSSCVSCAFSLVSGH
jgi:hypothetical protein